MNDKENITQQYDIIGDIHGHAEALANLLRKLGYGLQEGCYQHKTQKVIFLGDFIDRGPQQKEVINIVRPMVERAGALSVMGNHEFNAICYASLGDNGQPLRAHSEKNYSQHQAFLQAYPDDQERNQVISWFRTLPIFLDMGDFRVIHASWNVTAIATLAPLLNAENCLIESAYADCNDSDHPAYTAVEVLLKGPEAKLPDNLSFSDKDGNTRNNARINWWVPADSPAHARLQLGSQPGDSTQSPAIEIDSAHAYPANHKPLFIGHYWFDDEHPEPILENCACLDYSIAKGGKLVAYRFAGETTLVKQNFVW